MRQLLICTILLSLLYSCSKKDDLVYPVKVYPTFQQYSLTHFTGPRLFTAQGEITDPAIVSKYANEFVQFFYQPGSVFSFPAYKSFAVVNEDSILATGTVPIGELRRTSTGEYDIFSSGRLVPVNDTNALFLHLGKYPLHEVVSFPGSGYRYAELKSPAYIIKKVNDTLFLPMMRYIITSQRDHTFSFASDLLNNVFDPAGAAKLKPYDTLLLQSFDLELRRSQE